MQKTAKIREQEAELLAQEYFKERFKDRLSLELKDDFRRRGLAISHKEEGKWVYELYIPGKHHGESPELFVAKISVDEVTGEICLQEGEDLPF